MTKLIFGNLVAPEADETLASIEPFRFPPIAGKEALFLQILITLRINASRVRGLKPRPKGKLALETNAALIAAVLAGSSSIWYTLEDGFKYEVPLKNLGGTLDSFLSAMAEIETESGGDDSDEGSQGPNDNGADLQGQDGDSKNQVSMTFEPGSELVAVASGEGQQDAGQDLHQVAEEPVAETEQEEESEMDRMERELREGSGVNSQG